MITYHLKFDSEEQASLVLFRDELPLYQNIDVIGVYSKYDETSESLIAVDGWHVNVYSESELPELDKFKIEVNCPVRVIL